MIWQIKDKEEIIKTRFALFPVKIGAYWVWLSRYYKTWDAAISDCGTTIYVPHWFVNKEDIEIYVRAKLGLRNIGKKSDIDGSKDL